MITALLLLFECDWLYVLTDYNVIFPTFYGDKLINPNIFNGGLYYCFNPMIMEFLY